MCMCVCTGRQTVWHVSYTGAGARDHCHGGRVRTPTVSSNPAGIRRKLGTTIRGPTWQLEPWNQESRRAGEPADWPEWMSPAGLGWKTGKIGRLAARHGTGTDRQSEKERGNVCIPNACARSTWRQVTSPAAGAGAVQSGLALGLARAPRGRRSFLAEKKEGGSGDRRRMEAGPEAGPQNARAGPSCPRTLNPEVPH